VSGEQNLGPALAHQLPVLMTRCREAWPDVALSLESFERRLAERLAREDGPHASVLEKLALADLYIAWACLEGVPRAVEAFHQRFVPKVRSFLERRGLSADIVDEVEQYILCYLFVPDGDGAPRIDGYGGTGSLDAWLRTIALRRAMRLKRQAESHDDDELEWRASPARDPETAYFREHHGHAFKAVFVEALADLTPRERTLLRQHFYDGLSVRQLAPLHAVHPATVARRIAQLRARLFEETRRRLEQEGTALGVGSLARVVQSEIDLSLSRNLAVDGASRGGAGA
jgi:RNA polymerase sigma-70 factor, ECF subfamily